VASHITTMYCNESIRELLNPGDSSTVTNYNINLPSKLANSHQNEIYCIQKYKFIPYRTTQKTTI
jgi:hypothetical protein